MGIGFLRGFQRQFNVPAFGHAMGYSVITGKFVGEAVSELLKK